ncbi:Hypothetical predicted protein [Podarcis lilfordi]|uniref:Uncharacterized protein n=1 Tax=Podarcis lilfordi TaxID=74358 RepID=A0AA35KDB4_9SAUR|nr:Hypothetical predicted protein [Podarcis lilfordi]
MFNVQVSAGGKTLEERRSSLDAEIDSLTSILADLENSSPYKPRTQQCYARSFCTDTCEEKPGNLLKKKKQQPLLVAVPENLSLLTAAVAPAI